MADKLSRLEILEQVRQGILSAEAGLNLIKELSGLGSSGELVYYTTGWVETPLPDSRSRKTGDKNILLFMPEADFDPHLIMQWEEKYHCRLIPILSGDALLEQANGTYALDHTDYDSYPDLLDILTRKGITCNAIVHAFADTFCNSNCENLDQVLQKGIYSLFYTTKAWLAKKFKGELQLVFGFRTNSRTNEAVYTAAGAFSRTIFQETRRMHCKVVGADVDNRASLYELLITELYAGCNGEKPEVRYEAGLRLEKYTREVDDSRINYDLPLPLRPNGTYLITGGAGGLGFLLLEELLRDSKINVILTGRSNLSREKEQKIEHLRRLRGAEIRYIQSDMAAWGDILRVIEAITTHYGSLNGIVHAAGYIRDNFLMQKSYADFKSILRPKVYGTVNLDRATCDMPLDFFICFSSVAGVLGNIGQCDYAFANGFMDAFAGHRNQLVELGQRYGQTVSINWPLWQEGGMQIDEALRNRLEDSWGMVPLQTQPGLKAINAILQLPLSQAGVMQGNREKILASLTGGKQVVLPEEPALVKGEVSVADVGEKLAGICAELLKVKTHDLDRDTELFEYGVDSIMMISLINRIEKSFGDTIAPNAISEYPTLNLLAGHLIGAGIAKPEKKSTVQHRVKQAETPVYATVSLDQLIQENFTIAPQIQVDNQPQKQETEQDQRIAIISMAGRFPHASNLEQFWENLKNGVDCIDEVPKNREFRQRYYNPDKEALHTSYSQWGGFIDNIGAFDAGFFKIKDQEAKMMDPQHRIILELTQELIDRAGYQKADDHQGKPSLNGSRTCVYIGAVDSGYVTKHLKTIDKAHSKKLIVSQIENLMAARVSDFYNLKGISMTIDTACSSSLVAIHEAGRNLLQGESDLAIVGGIELILDAHYHVGFSKSGALSDKPHSFVFDERACGFVLGEGAGLLMMKRYQDAVKAGDNILGVVLGSAVNNDGHTMGLTTPSQEGQMEVIKAAIRRSKVNPADINYYEAHGTGTLLGDPIEIKAATTVYREYTTEKQYCAVGAVKSNIGHLLHGAGIAGVIKILLAMQHKTIPPTLHCENPHPRFKFEESPFFPVLKNQPWIAKGEGKQRLAAISAFGFGGTNCHLVMGEFLPEPGYVQQQRPGSLTRFARKYYWIGKAITEVESDEDERVRQEPEKEEIAPVLDDDTYRELLERLARGEIKVEEMIELEEGLK